MPQAQWDTYSVSIKGKHEKPFAANRVSAMMLVFNVERGTGTEGEISKEAPASFHWLLV